ncbi:hypothetical protein JW899_05165 [Candidatus Uhrbacteria bacterium]|nr:hypothetical protein [Candidatus Uhrbacteria bacterium]
MGCAEIKIWSSRVRAFPLGQKVFVKGSSYTGEPVEVVSNPFRLSGDDRMRAFVLISNPEGYSAVAVPCSGLEPVDWIPSGSL